MTPILEAKNLCLELNGRRIFEIDELHLHPGTVMALVGPNGAGKTSLLLTLALLQTPTKGTICFRGELVSSGNTLELRRRMALVFQDALLLDTTVYKNITIALRIRGITGREASVRTERWLERFGISHLGGRRARHLSGGESQRASLARAFALEPEVLFLDEPFSSLDFPTRKVLLNELGGVLREMKVTTVFVTHDLMEVPYLAARIAVLYQGRIIKSGTVEEILGGANIIPQHDEMLLWPG